MLRYKIREVRSIYKKLMELLQSQVNNKGSRSEWSLSVDKQGRFGSVYKVTRVAAIVPRSLDNQSSYAHPLLTTYTFILTSIL